MWSLGWEPSLLTYTTQAFLYLCIPGNWLRAQAYCFGSFDACPSLALSILIILNTHWILHQYGPFQTPLCLPSIHASHTLKLPDSSTSISRFFFKVLLERAKERGNFCPLAHSSNTCKSWGWARPKPRTEACSTSPMWVAGTQAPEPSAPASQDMH